MFQELLLAYDVACFASTRDGRLACLPPEMHPVLRHAALLGCAAEAGLAGSSHRRSRSRAAGCRVAGQVSSWTWVSRRSRPGKLSCSGVESMVISARLAWQLSWPSIGLRV